jgi:hypothetical protein
MDTLGTNILYLSVLNQTLGTIVTLDTIFLMTIG